MCHNMENISFECDVSDFGDTEEKREDLNMLPDQAHFQVFTIQNR